MTEYFKCLRALDPQPDLYLFTENNSADGTLEKIVAFDATKEIIRIWFRPDAVQATNGETPLALVRQLVLSRLRQLRPAHAFFCDSDVFVRSTDAITVLVDWHADLVGIKVARCFPEGLFLAAKWKHPYKPNAYKLKRTTNLPLDETPAMVGFGLVCIDGRVIQDRRINFYPLHPPLHEDKPTGNDFGYCLQMRECGYTVAIESIVVADHVVYDEKNEIKGWTMDAPRPFRF